MKSDHSEFVISEELTKKLDKLKDAGKKPIFLTEEQKAIVLNYYDKKDKRELAKFLGISECTLRRHHKELTSV